MSVSSFPEWKQLLLERKRREEEEKERREREEEARLASMPAWKREIIQRRRAKQEGGLGGREKERERGSEEVMVECEPLTPQVVMRAESRVMAETIRPLRQNPFIRSQSSRRKDGQEVGGATVQGVGQDRAKMGQGLGGEAGRERELRDTPEKEMREDRERDRGNGREADTPRVRREEWAEPDRGRSPVYPLLPRPLVPSMRTIRAENIIIIEKDRGGGKEREEGGVEEEDEEGGKRRMRMDLREILAGGGSVTEIKASEVLIIKPSPGSDKREACRERERDREGGKEGERDGQSDGEQGTREREGQAPMWREKERKEKEECGRVREVEIQRDRDAETEMERERGGPVLRERGWAETGVGLVSQLLSKFGEQPKPPSRSRSSDSFAPLPGRQDTEGGGAEGGGGKVVVCRGVPKRSVSFSDQAICAREKEGHREWVEPENQGRHSDGHKQRGGGDCHNEEAEHDEGEGPGGATGAEPKKEAKGYKGREGEGGSGGGEVGREKEEGFTLASLRNVEGIGFARRLVVRQEVKERGRERVVESERERMLEKGREASQRTEGEEETDSGRRGEGGEEKTPMGPACQRALDPIAPTEPEIRPAVPQTCTEAPAGVAEEIETPRCVPKAEHEIQVPRVHFYGEETTPGAGPGVGLGASLFTHCEAGGGGGGGGREGGKGLERKENWKAGRPLTRIESLREKIRQRGREQEREKEREGGKVEECRTGEGEGEKEDRGVERERERRLKAGEAEGQGEEAVMVEEEEQGGLPPLLHVTQEQEVAVPKPGPRLPASIAKAAVSGSAVVAEEQRSFESPPSPGVQGPAGGQEQGRAAGGSPCNTVEEKEGEREGDGRERDCQAHYLPPSLSPSPTRSLSPPLPVQMSHFVGFTAAGCRGAASFDRAQGVGPEDEGAEPRPGRGLLPGGQEGSRGGLATVQKQVELLHLRKQEAGMRPPQPGQKAKGEAQPALHVQRMSQLQLRNQRTTQPIQPVSSSQPQTPRSFTIVPRAGLPSPKNSEQAFPVTPTPPSTFCSLRNSGGVQGKRGNTITITPRKLPAGPGAASAGPTPTPSSLPTPNGTGTGPEEGGKKRYPTAEQIQVIGGYKNLDRSCLAKQGRKHKVKVCFDETRLERVCEYPSESSVLACFPCSVQPRPESENQAREAEDDEEEEEEEKGVFFYMLSHPGASR